MTDINILKDAAIILGRDFEIQDISSDNSLKSKELYGRLLERVIAAIEYLIDHDLEKLKWILYRIDVNEKKLQEMLVNSPPGEAASIIAEMILQRQIEKAKTRKAYKSTDQEEEWLEA